MQNSAQSFARIFVAILLGVAVTALLLLGMRHLILSGNQQAADKNAIRLADIWQPEMEIEEQTRRRKLPKPIKPVPAPKVPPAAVPQQAQAAPDVVAAQPMGNIQLDVPTVMTPSVNLTVGQNSAPASPAATAATSSDAKYIPVYVPQPKYPPRARRRGVEGYAVVELIITKIGGVRDVKLVEENPANKGFGKYAMRAAKRLKYKPRIADGKPVEVSGVLYKFSFKMAKN